MSNKSDPAVAEACAFLQERSKVGIEKYGRTVRQSPDDMGRHATEEAADLLVYLTEEECRKKHLKACLELLEKENERFRSALEQIKSRESEPLTQASLWSCIEIAKAAIAATEPKEEA